MSGHSKWHSIRHKKGALDAKRGKIFTKIIKEISIAARMGGADVNANPRLRTAILKAKGVNMPKDNIERAIKKGSGELDGANYEEIVYEGFGPGGTAFYVEVLTDNRNRTAAEIRNIFNKNGGNMGEKGSVAYMFEKKGIIVVDKEKSTEDDIMEIAINSGADDVQTSESGFEVVTETNAFEDVLNALKENNIEPDVAEITMIANVTSKVDETGTDKVNRLVDLLEDNLDVQSVSTNMEI